ncbi:hypothetical protein TNCV_2220951 [Trichonephila clavipes]|nr:hypothetical protein TNCV_2220951 [Trichonephila clavipes]
MRSPTTCYRKHGKELSNGQLRMPSFAKFVVSKNATTYPDCFICIPQSLPDKLAIIVIRFLRLLVPQLSVLPKLFLHHCISHPHAMLEEQRDSLPGRSKSCSYKVSIEEVASATIIAVIKSRPASVFHLVHLCKKKTSKLCHSWNGRAPRNIPVSGAVLLDRKFGPDIATIDSGSEICVIPPFSNYE